MSMIMVNMMSQGPSLVVADDELSINSSNIFDLSPEQQQHLISATASTNSSKKCKTQSENKKSSSLSGSLTTDSNKDDPLGVHKVHKNVFLLLERWGRVLPIPPDLFLLKLVQSCGYNINYRPYSDSGLSKRVPTTKQIQDYSKDLVVAVRNSDLDKLQSLHSKGHIMSACNKYSESIFHMACRRSEFEVVDFILTNGGDLSIIDDYGRTVLHDACWRVEPRFDIATLLLDYRPDLLFQLDVRGSPPLQYVKQDSWIYWCAYLFHQKERYWPATATSSSNSSLMKRKRDGEAAAEASTRRAAGDGTASAELQQMN